jgi:hypothetical protein
MSEPRTEAGKRLLNIIAGMDPRGLYPPNPVDAILAIEAEAREQVDYDYILRQRREAREQERARHAALVEENSRLRHLLAVALDPSEDEEHEWCDVTSGGEHTFDRFSFERDARAALASEEER